MANYSSQELYDALVIKYAPPVFQTYPTQDQLNRWSGHLSDYLLRWWSEQGWGPLANGQYWVCSPDQLRPVLEEVFAGDPQYHANDLIPFGYNALGMIDVFMGEGRTMTIDLVFGTVIWRDHTGTPSEEEKPDFMAIYFRINGGAHRLIGNLPHFNGVHP